MSDRLLSIHSRQRRVKLNSRFIRKVVLSLLSREFQATTYELSLRFVGASEMTMLNETYLRHKGSTDVITFDYGSVRGEAPLAGDVVVCVDEAIAQARRFGATWQTELMRYVVHGLLHLSGFDDKTAAKRREMKRREDQLVRAIAGQFSLAMAGSAKPR